MSVRDRGWNDARLHVVTGKGGTGKTTIAAALALALAASGRTVLLTEVEERQGIAQVFDCAPLPYAERRVAVAPDGGDVYALAIDAEAALLDYLEMFYGLRRAGAALTRFGVVDFATTVAPGTRDVLLTGKVTEAVRRRQGEERGRTPRDATRRAPFVYDAVVLDAPPTGRIAQFLNVNTEVAGLARMGPVHHHADRVMEVIRSAQTAVHVVTTLEDMPVQECLDGVEQITDVNIPVGSILVNMRRPRFLNETDQRAAAEGRVDTEALARGLKAAGLEQAEQTAQELVPELLAHAHTVAAEQGLRERLEAAQRPTFDLPLLEGPIDLAGLYHLANVLRTQGAV
ncbi:ArsA-related P-loop ATPase [Lipingzhangella sp. LS1_29]|uniref:ArsA-related P-loop ATPase n=1 Tax=Lipingzhangella rawalii TaxID=2055835 RepID=A0ABU2H5V9_9ACTN|nr:ArsA-related P-loop ATPase [Lipingzhangella rawalii]MDS1270004.1 ArsA-related P-loop ATPase [Lipingzhangella rawalii]